MTGMDPLDDLDRRVVVALQNDGRASWTDIAQAAGSSVATVARRGQQLLARGLVRIAAVPSVDRFGPTEQLLVRLRCEAGAQHRVAQVIAARPDVRFVCLVTGAHDLVAEILTPKGSDLVTVLVDQLQGIPGVVSSEAELVLHMYKVSHDWSRQILGDAAPAATARELHVCGPSDFDDTDEKILAFLREDGRASFPVVAQAMGVNESTVRRRFETSRRAAACRWSRWCRRHCSATRPRSSSGSTSRRPSSTPWRAQSPGTGGCASSRRRSARRRRCAR